MYFLGISMIFFLCLHHPLVMILSLISMTLFISFYLSLVFKMMWISLIFILMILGGMLILFIYMASLASNESLEVSNKKYFLLAFVLLFMMSLNMKQNLNFLNFISGDFFTVLSNYSSMSSIFSLSYLMFYLLFVIEILAMFKNPLRSSF